MGRKKKPHSKPKQSQLFVMDNEGMYTTITYYVHLDDANSYWKTPSQCKNGFLLLMIGLLSFRPS